jgi:hypothetical protein
MEGTQFLEIFKPYLVRRKRGDSTTDDYMFDIQQYEDSFKEEQKDVIFIPVTYSKSHNTYDVVLDNISTTAYAYNNFVICRRNEDFSIAALLSLLLVNINRIGYPNPGLCSLVTYLKNNEIINYTECLLIKNYIKHNEPFLCKVKNINDVVNDKDHYFWNRGDKKPREKWLKQHIKVQIKLNKR